MPHFGCASAALCLRGESFLSDSIAISALTGILSVMSMARMAMRRFTGGGGISPPPSLIPLAAHAGLTLDQVNGGLHHGIGRGDGLGVGLVSAFGLISIVNAVAMSTFEASSDAPSRVPLPPVPGAATLAAPDARLVW